MLDMMVWDIMGEKGFRASSGMRTSKDPTASSPCATHAEGPFYDLTTGSR